MSGTVYKHEHRVIYAECTLGNHVYYSRYLDMLEAARGEFFRDIGHPLLSLQEQGTIFPVISVDISYKGMARYDDLLTVELFAKEAAGIRFTIGFRILNADGALLAEGQTRHVCAGLDEKPKRMPKELTDKLLPYLQVPAHVA